jgi:hypothetical protein
MHHPHDQRFKALVAACMDLAVDVYLERSVHVAPQRIDVAYEPRARVPELGCMDRLAALGPGMMEYFAGRLSEEEIMGCMRKRLSYCQERALDASRRGIPTPPEPRLWILAAQPPRRAVLQAHAAEPMRDWPSGFWQAHPYEWMCFVVLDELPEGHDTLLLRLFGQGRTLQRALAELKALPPDHVLKMRAPPVLVAYSPTLMQDLENDHMNALQEAQALYQEWEQRTERNALARLLTRQLAQRFGDLSPETVERIRHASGDTLELWGDRVLTAQSLDDVFA